MTGEDISINILASKLANFKQRYTIEGGKRPFGVQSLVLGYCSKKGMECYVVDPDGNYSRYLCGAIGNKASLVVEYLEKAVIDESVTIRGMFEAVKNDVEKVRCFNVFKDRVEIVKDEVVKGVLDSLVTQETTVE